MGSFRGQAARTAAVVVVLAAASSLRLAGGQPLAENTGAGITLIEAVKANDLGLVAKLLAGGADVMQVDSIKRTPLHWAGRMGYTDILKLLLTYNPDMDALDRDSSTALGLARWQKHTEAEAVLVANKERNTFAGGCQYDQELHLNGDSWATVCHNHVCEDKVVVSTVIDSCK
ncbi:uncharacterized protein LOC134763028 [Penaeus indicus]|uniref:uncharacterized protein LOC134763028 n=1 Tax=Penaeus indicus TaxID=29960 RepID=UPI00300CE865